MVVTDGQRAVLEECRFTGTRDLGGKGSAVSIVSVALVEVRKCVFSDNHAKNL